MKTCPFCKEEIHDEAIKCKHCHSMVDPEQPQFQTGGRQVVYFVDRDLVLYIKVAVGVVSIVVAVVTFGFGFNLWHGASSVTSMKEKVEGHVKTLESKIKKIDELEVQAQDNARSIRDARISVGIVDSESVTEERVREIIAEFTKVVDTHGDEFIEVGYPDPRRVPASSELKAAFSTSISRNESGF